MRELRFKNTTFEQKMAKSLHIVCFDNPYPPNYGGIIDVYFKIKALHQLGYQVYLHCYVKEVPHELDTLQGITQEVFFYPIRMNPFYFFSAVPFSVRCRDDQRFAENIQKMDAPVLFEGLKTVYALHTGALKTSKAFLRLQNIEEHYFEGISKQEKSLVKKLLFKIESLKYAYFKAVFSKFLTVFTLSKYENDLVKSWNIDTLFVPVFHGNERVVPLDGFGSYALYHGDLNTSDNRKAVLFLIEVFKQLPHHKLVIAAGRKESFVTRQLGNQTNISFVRLEDFDHLKRLFKEAHICLSWSFQKAGTKLKLINSIFNSRHCLINENVIDDKIIEDLCIKVQNQSELLKTIPELFSKPFNDYERRRKVLEEYMSDLKNAEVIAQKMFES